LFLRAICVYSIEKKLPKTVSDELSFEIEFAPEDSISESDVMSFVDDLHDAETMARIDSRHHGAPALEGLALVALISVLAPTAAGLAVTAAFIYKVFRQGVVIDLTKDKPRIKRSPDLPRGAMLVLKPGGKSELKDGISDSALATAIRDVLKSRPKNTGSKKD
jgi:hypothetical protein